MRLSSIPRVNSNHRKRRFAANGSRMDTGVKRKWRLVRGRVAFECGGESRRENEDEEFLVLFLFFLREVEGRNDVSVLLRSRNLSLFENLVEDVFVTSFSKSKQWKPMIWKICSYYLPKISSRFFSSTLSRGFARIEVSYFHTKRRDEIYRLGDIKRTVIAIIIVALRKKEE